MGDTIDPTGWDLGPFLKNPVALFGHDSSAPPIGRASNVTVENGKLMGDIEFAPAETYAFADTIYKLVVGKYLNAVSVGFLPLEYDFSEDDSRPWGLDFKLQELMEISVVPVPANSNALAGARSKGIDTRPLVAWAEKTLDGGGKVIIPRKELEALRKQAAEPRRAKSPAGMGETDPASGGAIVPTCGKAKDETCGMVDPSECDIHGSNGADEAEDKDMVASIRRAVREEVRRALKALNTVTRADDDSAETDTDETGNDKNPELEKSFRGAHAHFKAAEDLYEAGDDHHEKGMSALESILVSIVEPAAEPDGEKPDPEEESEKAARLRLIKAIRRRHGV
jgi:HK97 family phage prohead protease